MRSFYYIEPPFLVIKNSKPRFKPKPGTPDTAYCSKDVAPGGLFCTLVALSAQQENVPWSIRAGLAEGDDVRAFERPIKPTEEAAPFDFFGRIKPLPAKQPSLPISDHSFRTGHPASLSGG